MFKKDFSFLFSTKISHYWFNREKILQNAKEKYGNGGGKEKATKYYKTNNDKREYSKNRYKEMEKNANLFLSCINE